MFSDSEQRNTVYSSRQLRCPHLAFLPSSSVAAGRYSGNHVVSTGRSLTSPRLAPPPPPLIMRSLRARHFCLQLLPVRSPPKRTDGQRTPAGAGSTMIDPVRGTQTTARPRAFSSGVAPESIPSPPTRSLFRLALLSPYILGVPAVSRAVSKSSRVMDGPAIIH